MSRDRKKEIRRKSMLGMGLFALGIYCSRALRDYRLRLDCRGRRGILDPRRSHALSGREIAFVARGHAALYRPRRVACSRCTAIFADGVAA